MRVIRSTGQNVSPSDDGRLYNEIFTDGLFTESTFTNIGGNNIQISAIYGDLCGRDFTIEQTVLAVTLPEGDTESTGYIYVEIDTSSDDVITLNSALAPFTPTYEDINTNGAVAQMILAEYTASAVAVQTVTPVYNIVSAGSVLPGSVATVETSPAKLNHSAGEYILYGGQLYKVTASISAGQSLTPGTNITATSAGSELTSLTAGLADISLSNSEQSPSNVSCANTTVVTLATVSIPETGVYILWGYHEWSASFSQTYQDVWAYSGTTFTKRSMTGVNGGGSEFVITAKINAGTSATYQTYQTSGATQTASRIRVRYIKVASS